VGHSGYGKSIVLSTDDHGSASYEEEHGMNLWKIKYFPFLIWHSRGYDIVEISTQLIIYLVRLVPCVKDIGRE